MICRRRPKKTLLVGVFKIKILKKSHIFYQSKFLKVYFIVFDLNNVFN